MFAITYILGITGITSQNVAAALLKDGRLVAVAEEERFNRIKHSPRIFPTKAVEFCLKQENLRIEDVEIAVGWNYLRNFSDRAKFLLKYRKFALFYFLQGFYKLTKNDSELLKYEFTDYSHHMAHAASAFFCSGFKKSNIMSMDGRGEAESTFLAHGNSEKITPKLSSCYSLGSIYGLFTDYLGFIRHSHEGKVMGLASYGKPLLDTSNILKLTKNNFKVNLYGSVFNQSKFFIQSLLSTITSKDKTLAKREELVNKFIREIQYKPIKEIIGIPRRHPNDPITINHQNVAASVQNIYEKALIHLARVLYEKTGDNNFSLAGGCVLNCTGNGTLFEQDFVKNIFIQPAASDAGTAIGAAFLKYTENHQRKEFVMRHASWGPEFDNEEIEKELKESKYKYEFYQDIESEAAHLLNDNNIIGWFQGRMELGPRALGNRSILANSTNFEMKDKVNMQVKHREPWRPFAPSLLKKAAKEYFGKDIDSPFMILAFKVLPEKWGEIPAVIHIDGTARPQTVEKEINPRYYKMISEFEKLSGVPVVLNTSFNDRGEPIVCTPRDSLRTFSVTGLDKLVIGNYVVSKEKR